MKSSSCHYRPPSAPVQYGQCIGSRFRPSSHALCHRVLAASQLLAENSVRTTCDAYDQLSLLCAAQTAATVSTTALGRGLVASRDIAAREPVVAVDVQNALVIADDPVNGISIYSDTQHRKWQELYGELPELLLEFLQGEARWDIRMAAWLLHLKQHRSPLWSSYLAVLPAERDMACLLNYSRDEIVELQVPSLQAEALIQADWAAYLHGAFLHHKSGSLAPLKLSSTLQESLWALAMVRSRTFSEEVNGEGLTLMVPYADLANHSFDNNTTFNFNQSSKWFQLQALQPLAAGTEVTISYGAMKPNEECLRDYGFIIPGNPCDRVRFSSTSASSSTSSTSSTDDLEGLPRLNPVSLLQAVGFTGDLTQADIQPAGPAAADPQQQLRLARRKAALLSMPVNAPQAAATGGKGNSSSSSSSSGGLFGWLDAATQPWTPAGRPAPEPLKQQQVPAERAAVQQLQDLLVQQLARLPTSAAYDEDLIHQAEVLAASGSSSSSSGSSSSSNTSVPVAQAAPVVHKRVADVNQQGHWNAKQQQRQRVISSNKKTAGGAAAMADAAALFHNPRLMTAVRARLEQKLLLREAIAVLMLYEKHLATY